MMDKINREGNGMKGTESGSGGLRPAELLRTWAGRLARAAVLGPVLDLACGEGGNGLFLARQGAEVVLADRDGEKLDAAQARARELGLAERVRIWRVDLEAPENPLPRRAYGGIAVFRYLHRPLLPGIASALQPGGVLVYETFMREQAKLGRPTNPDFLLKPDELLLVFSGWQVLHSHQGLLNNPKRYVAQLVARKPSQGGI